MSLEIVGFKNKNDAPLALEIPGFGRRTLTYKDEMLRDDEGNPIVLSLLQKSEYRELGLEPIFRKKADPAASTPSTPEPVTAAPMEVPASPTPAPVVAATAPAVAKVQEATTPATSEWSAWLDKTVTPNVWELRKDKYRSATPAGIKMHVRRVFGDEAYAKVTFERS